jgi:hypothetical protein
LFLLDHKIAFVSFWLNWVTDFLFLIISVCCLETFRQGDPEQPVQGQQQ